MLYSEIIAVCSEIHTKHINTLCAQNVGLLNVKLGGTYSKHYAFKELSTMQCMLMGTRGITPCILEHRNKIKRREI
jgi:hypothetical protein